VPCFVLREWCLKSVDGYASLDWGWAFGVVCVYVCMWCLWIDTLLVEADELGRGKG
jgi:hypothetical protein